MAEKEISLTQGDFIKVDGRVDIEKRVQYLTKRMHEWDYTTPLTIVLKPYFNPRSINQNALFHMWCREMADHFITFANTKNKTVKSTDIKYIMLYAAARYSAHVAKNVIEIDNHEEFVKHMSAQYIDMLREHLADPNL